MISDYCTHNDCIVLTYLFGSYARKAAGPLSDYDITFLLHGTVTADERYRWMHELSQLLGGSPVDLIILNTAPVELCYHIIAKGQRIYERDLFPVWSLRLTP